MATVSNLSEEVREKMVNPIRWAILLFSLGLLGLTTAMFYNYFGDFNGFEGSYILREVNGFKGNLNGFKWNLRKFNGFKGT